MTTLTHDSPMPFGKYKGTPLSKVPADYLLWIWDLGPSLYKHPGGLSDYIKANFRELEANAPDVIVHNRPDVSRS